MRIRVPGGGENSKEWTEVASSQPVPGPESTGPESPVPEISAPETGATAVPEKPWQRYLVSLPERALRSATALSAGLLRELSDVTLPRQVRQSKLYSTMVEATLRFLIEEVGQVEGAYPAEGRLSEDFAFRRTAGNGIELAGILAFRASPVWVMAALADVSGSGRHLIREITDCLKQEGLLEKDRDFESIDQMLDGLEKSSGRLADAINTPPLDVASLRREWTEFRKEARQIAPSKLPSAASVRAHWDELRAVAARENRTVFEISSAMALAAVASVPSEMRWLSRSAKAAGKHTGQLVAGALLEHYRETLAEIRRAGFLAYWRGQFRPYLKAAALQFSPKRVTLLERLWAKSRGKG
jgi:hypothetical protein